MSKNHKENDVVMDLEDEKETIEVDLESAGLLSESQGSSSIEDTLEEINEKVKDLEEEKDEILKRISMAIGDSKVALDKADDSMKNIRQIKKATDKQARESEKKITAFSNQLNKVVEDVKKIDEIKSDLKDQNQLVQDLKLKLEDLEKMPAIKEDYRLKLQSAEDRSEEIKGLLLINLDQLEQKLRNIREEWAEKLTSIESKVSTQLLDKVAQLEEKIEKMGDVSSILKDELGMLSKTAQQIEDALERILKLEQTSDENKDKIEQVIDSFAKLDEHFNNMSQDYNKKVEETSKLVHDLLEEKAESIGRSLEQLKEKMESRLLESLEPIQTEIQAVTDGIEHKLEPLKRDIQNVSEQIDIKLEPIKNELKTVTGELDQKLEPFRTEIEEAKSLLEKELIKVKESWDKIDNAVSDSGGAMEIAQKAKESLERMEKEINSALGRLDNLMTSLNENTLKSNSNKELIDQTIKLVDDARERIKGMSVPGIQALAAAAPVLTVDEEIIFSPSEISGELDTSQLGFELDDLLQVMIKHDASDLHIKSGSPPTVRMDGELIPVGSQILSDYDCKLLILSCMTPFQRRQLGRKREVDFAYAIPDARFRVNAFLQKQSVSASYRLLRTDIPTVEEMNLPPMLKKLCEHNHGLILITGPAGSGKSTTLATMINYINETKKQHIVTIEDPIEFIHTDKSSIITQREVGTDTESFAVALKQSLRQDPNVILIGEMRDPETIMTAAIAAETGHLVLSTLHTPNTIQAINRIIDVFTGDVQKQFRLLLSNVLRGIVSQRLLMRADDQGRIPAVEVLVVTPTVSSLILDEKTNDIYTHMVQGRTEGMQTFTQSLMDLYEKGLVSKEEAMYHADQPTEFRLSIEGHTTGTAAIQDENLMSWL